MSGRTLENAAAPIVGAGQGIGRSCALAVTGEPMWCSPLVGQNRSNSSPPRFQPNPPAPKVNPRPGQERTPNQLNKCLPTWTKTRL